MLRLRAPPYFIDLNLMARMLSKWPGHNLRADNECSVLKKF